MCIFICLKPSILLVLRARVPFIFCVALEHLHFVNKCANTSLSSSFLEKSFFFSLPPCDHLQKDYLILVSFSSVIERQ